MKGMNYDLFESLKAKILQGTRVGFVPKCKQDLAVSCSKYPVV